MEVNHPHRKLLGGRQKALDPTMEIVHKAESFQKNGRLPPHSVRPARGDNHVQPPLHNSRSSKPKKLPQIVHKKIFPCKTCLRPFTNRTSAHFHARTHLNPHQLERSSIFHDKCPHCQKVFFDHHQLTRHLFIHLSGEERAEVRQSWRHVCYFCTKRFRNPSHLSRHLVVHTKEKVSWRCAACRKTFSSNQTLRNHRFTHLSEDEKVALVKQGRSRVCLFCQKIFPDNRTYHAHLVSHTEEKPFRCVECDQTFGQKHHLARHEKNVHRKLKDFACPECAKKFGRRSHMVRHLSSVHAQIRHPCPLCGETFSRKDHLGGHLKKVHPQE
ncbi:gastrula zinc finger protein XlCGF8.2DB [Folsomia candida]|nr:gastrula zinc finger protein XlCGF8.2DB [Folsomia candida]